MYSYLKYKEGCFLFDISVIYDAGVVDNKRGLFAVLFYTYWGECYESAKTEIVYY